MEFFWKNVCMMLGLVSKSVRYDVGDIETWIASNLKLLMMNDRYRDIIVKTFRDIFSDD